MKINTLIIITLVTLFTISCEKSENIFEIENKKENVSVEIETKNVSHLDHAVYTVLEDGKLVVFFSQMDLKGFYDKNIDTSAGKKGITLPTQIFYIGVYPATEGIFPDFAKHQLGAINYTNIKFNTDLTISPEATQSYIAKHVIINATTPPIEVGKYEINIEKLEKDNYITGHFSGVMAKINLETKQPDPTANPIMVNGSFENVGYIDFEKIKNYIPFDISGIIK